MPLVLQLTLIIFCLGLLFLIIRQISSSRVVFSDFNYWILFIVLLLILAIFPQLADYFAKIFNIQTPVIAVFLAVIFLLILLLLSASFRISVLNRRFIQLTQKIALLEHDLEKRVESLEDQKKKNEKK